MSPHTWLQSFALANRFSQSRKPSRRCSQRLRAGFEVLEDRITPSHFRYGTIDWAPTSGNSIEFHLTQGWRLDFPWTAANPSNPAPIVVGSVVDTGQIFNFGDSTIAAIVLTITSVNALENSFVGTATLTHTYATAGNKTAFMTNAARISTTAGLKNNGDGNFRTETLVNVGAAPTNPFSGNHSPVSSLPPIVQVQDNQIWTFQLPAVDPDGDPLTYRLATALEAASGGPYVHPGNFSISTSGLITWDVRNVGGLATVSGDLWTTQIEVEDHTVGGGVMSKIPVDFLLQIIADTNDLPVVNAVPPGPFAPIAGTPLSFTVNAADPDAGDTIVSLLAISGAPLGMTFSPFAAGNPTSITASWTPTVGQAGSTFLVVFQATDNHGATGNTTVSITPSANQSPTANGGGGYHVNEGGTVALHGSGTDPENGPLTYDWDLDDNGTFETPGQDVTFSAAGLDGFPGSHRHVFLRVTDNVGNIDIDEAVIFIDNVAPTITSVSGNTIDENGTATVSGTYHDDGIPDTHTIVINWNASGNVGGLGEGSTTLTTAGPNPVGSSITYLGNGDWSFTATHQYLDDNPTGGPVDTYGIHVTVTDDDSGEDSDDTTVTVKNRDPVIDMISGPQTIDEGQSVTVAGTFHDDGSQDTHTGLAVWSDGAVSAVAIVGHTFSTTRFFADDDPATGTASDAFTVSVTILDDDGGSSSGSSSGSWSYVAQMGQDRYAYAGVTGADGKIYVATGQTFSSPLDSLEIYTPSTNTWASGADLPTSLTLPVAGAGADGRIYVMGGQDTSTFAITNAVYVYTPLSDTWGTATSMPAALYAAAAATGNDGRIYVTGGNSPALAGLTDALYIYDPSSDSWSTGASMPNARYAHSSAAGIDGRIYVFGGYLDTFGTPTTSVIAYDPVTDSWASVASMPTNRILAGAAAAADGSIYVVNGVDAFTGYTTSVYVFTPSTDSWSAGPSTNSGRYGLAAAGADGSIYAIGGFDAILGTTTNAVEKLNTNPIAGGASASVTVRNVDPTILTISGPQSINEGQSATVSGTFSDPALGVATEAFTGTALWSDGVTTAVTIVGNTFSTTRAFPDDNPTGTLSDVFTVSITIGDDDLGSDSESAQVTVNNVAPVLASLGNSSPECGGAAEGQAVNVTGSFTDVGILDVHTATINWGDGNTTTATISESGGSGTFAGSHPYAAGGIYTITVTLKDDDGGTVTKTTTAVVTGVGVIGGTLYVIGTDNADHITINQAGSVYRVHADFLTTGAFRDVPIPGVTRIVVEACDGDDQVTVSAGITLSALIDGGEGKDKLNGGNGPNVIVGGAGDDDINGGSSNDILIGGAGADRIVGNAGDDLLIAGSTDSDGLYEALFQLLAEWNSGAPAATRRNHILGVTAGGLNTTLLNSSTVHDDAAVDKLTGSAGTDWFFANLDAGVKDTITGKDSGELVQEI